jgi:hypothetical protein
MQGERSGRGAPPVVLSRPGAAETHPWNLIRFVPA